MPKRLDTRATERRILESYQRSWSLLRSDLEALQTRVAAARAAGQPIRRSWLLKEARIEDTLSLLGQQVSLLSEQAKFDVVAERARAAQEGAAAAISELGDVAFPARPSLQAMERLTSSGNIERLFASLGPDAVGKARDSLVTGLLLGKHPSVVARELRDVLGVNALRAQTIARTEILRSYRDAAQLTYQRNSDVVQGWVWFSAADHRTCAMCWSLHGKQFEVSERHATHPGCRCTLRPVTERTGAIKTGEERFRDLPETYQRRILGPGRFQLWQDGTPFTDFASKPFKTPYGPGRRLRTLRELSNAT